MNPVTDPAILAQLNGPQPVTNPAILAQLNNDAPQASAGQFQASMPGRVLHGAMDPVYGIGQAVPHALAYATALGGLAPNSVSRAYDQSAQMLDKGNSEREQSYQSARSANGQDGMDIARFAGNIISPANYGLGMAAGALPEATSLGGRVLQGAAVGAGYGASSPVDTTEGSYANQKAWQTGIGSVMGSAAPVVGAAVSHLIKPNISPDAQLLIDEGIRLTPGQRNGGAIKTIEDKLTSVPVVGDVIKSAQGRSIEDLNKAVANRALKPIGGSLPDDISGRDAVGYVKNTLGDAYDKLLPNLTAKPDAQFAQDMQGISQSISTLPAQEQKVYADILNRQIQNRASSGVLAGQDLKDAQSGIGKEFKAFSASPDAYQRKLADALKDTQESLRTLVGRSNPQHAGELEKIDQGYANYARMRQAASYVGAENGIFSPAQLTSAVRSADKTVGHGGFATGNAYMQDLSDAAKNVLPSKYPDSGTAGRYLMAALLGKEGLMAAPMALLAGVPTAAIYSSPASKMADALSKRPAAFQPVAEGLAKYSNPAALAKFLTRQ